MWEYLFEFGEICQIYHLLSAMFQTCVYIVSLAFEPGDIFEIDVAVTVSVDCQHTFCRGVRGRFGLRVKGIVE